MVAVIAQTTGEPAQAHVGDGVRFDALNGGWIIVFWTDGRSVSLPVRRVQGIYKVEDPPR